MQAYDYSGHNFDATYGNSDGTVGSGCLDGGENIDINAQYGPNPNDYLNGYPGLPVNNGCAGLSSYFSNGYLTVPPLNLNTNTVTFTMWIHPNDPFGVIAPNSGLLMNRNGGDTAGVGFSGNQNANLTAALGYTWNNNSPATYGWNSLLYPVPQQWQFVAYVISPQNTTIYHCYVSGGQTNLYKAVNNITNAPEAFSGGTTWLGSDNWNNGRAFNGSIDEVAVFNRAMSENQIVDLFLKALGGLVPPPPTPWPVEPTNTTLFLGQMLQLTAIAGGIPAPHYQWQVWYNSTWMNLSGNPNLGIAPTTNTTLYWTNFVGAFSNFRCFATNYYYGWSSISSTATVTVIPVANWNKGLGIVNFAITPPGPNGPYVGRGVLGTSLYWNALRGSGVFGGMQFTNTSPSLQEDGVTVSGINFGSTPIYMGAVESGGSNNALLDTYCSFVSAGAAFAFTSVPNGTYNLALYGIDGGDADLGTTFTVNGVGQSVINAQDSVFLPDNTVVYTNVVVTNGTLNVTMVPVLRRACPMWGCPGAFNGAQLELIQYPPPPPIVITNINGQLVLQWSAGWKLLQATNVLGPWTTNNWLPPQHTLTPTGQMQFFRVCTNSSWE
jgi:hypothetical protein